MERSLQKLDWGSVKRLVPAEIDTIILPVGTVEAHGSSCLGTDNFIPETIAEGIAPRIAALIAPTISYGISRSLYRYNGTSTIEPAIFRGYVGNVLDSFADSSFKNIVILNGHGGNNEALKAEAFEFHRRRSSNIAVIHWWELCGEMTREFFGHVGGHAGTDETAMVQAIDEKLAGAEAYDSNAAYCFVAGADVYPVPGTILLYREGEGYPEFDAARAREYKEMVIKKVGDFAEMVISRWRLMGL